MDVTVKKAFEEQLREKFQDLTHKQTVFFVWLCAVRALPLMGVDRSLYHWKEEYRQKHTYDIFNALDIVYAYVFDIPFTTDIEFIYNSVCESLKYDTTKIVAESTALAVKSAKEKFLSVDEIIACMGYINNTAYKNNMDFKDIWLNDIDCIKSNSLSSLNNDIKRYGVCWDNLRAHCFADMNCVYWIDLYIGIFKDVFQLDKEELKRRLIVPNEIQKRGAKAVADIIVT